MMFIKLLSVLSIDKTENIQLSIFLIYILESRFKHLFLKHV